MVKSYEKNRIRQHGRWHFAVCDFFHGFDQHSFDDRRNTFLAAFACFFFGSFIFRAALLLAGALLLLIGALLLKHVEKTLRK